MDEQNEIIKICRACGHEREYDNYHRLYVACKNVPVHDLLNTIKKIEKKNLKKLECIVKIIKINLNETGKLLTHARKIYKIFTIRLTP